MISARCPVVNITVCSSMRNIYLFKLDDMNGACRFTAPYLISDRHFTRRRLARLREARRVPKALLGPHASVRRLVIPVLPILPAA
jgi:hypothetical protein